MAEMNGTGSVGGNAQNIPEAHVPRTRSSFPLKAHRYNTERYGEYTPIIAFESVKEDILPVRLSHNLMSYTMKKPLMSELQKIKDLFSVPMEAILPLNWEKFYDNPVRGDDVSDDVGPAISGFWYQVGTSISSLFTALKTLLNNSSTTDAQALQAVLRFFIIAEYFYSDGSLMSTLGCHGSRFGRFDFAGDKDTVDNVFDGVCSLITSNVSPISGFVLQQLNIADYNVSYGILYENLSNEGTVPFRHALCLMRDDPTCWVKSVTLSSGASAGDLRNSLNSFLTSFTFERSGSGIPFNTQFLSAYQLCCAHYMSNDHVDFVYSAELYRQLIGHYLSYHSSYVSSFVRNGINYKYDFLSAHAISYIVNWTAISSSLSQYLLTVTNTAGSAHDGPRSVLGFLSSIFSFRRSLKYLDYFSGARTQPLAVVGTGASNTSVAVNNNAVSVIDITRSIQAQRFLNSVNRIGHQFEKYLKGLFGGKMPAPDYHNPFHLANIIDTVYGDETQNTGDAQINPSGNSQNLPITTTLRSNSSKYMFEVNSDRPCIIIAITHYDVPRVHQYTTDRSFFHVNRFDYFNPFLQYTGDQPIYLQELGTQSFLPTTPLNFAYTMKHMEYKQLYNTCSGGFINNLPGFIFPASDKRGSSTILSDEWIRCVQCEFDYFYTSLTGYSLASYFHFIVDNFVDFSGTRPMAFAPQILG